ncbi:hypothetical protein, partial [Acinetobacter baumannii]|uniref:hypothetical protein n=1 Tax=Acinetobacter baumannii TaxID=470 RepID=UPI00227984F5
MSSLPHFNHQSMIICLVLVFYWVGYGLYPLSSRRFPSQFSPSNRPASVGFFTALRLAAPPLHS